MAKTGKRDKMYRKPFSLMRVALEDFKGKQPAADYQSPKVRNYVEGEMTEAFGDFMQNMITPDVVQGVRRIAEAAGIRSGEVSDRPFFVTDDNLGISGAKSNSCAIVVPGERGYPVRIVIAHTDSPCLKVNGIWGEIDAELQNACDSLYFQTRPYGGLRKRDWFGRSVKAVGWVYDGRGKSRRIDQIGSIPNMSVHVEKDDDPKETFDHQGRTYSNLRVKTGARDLPELFQKYGFRNESDLLSSDIFVVPNEGRNLKVVGNGMTAYGLDDRSCVWTTAEAASEAAAMRKGRRKGNTIITLYVDGEEILSQGVSSGYRGFVESVIKESLRQVLPESEFSKLDLPLDLVKDDRLMRGMPMVVSDVSIALGPVEAYKHRTSDGIDLYNSPLSGWGAVLSNENGDCDTSETSPVHIKKMMDLMDRGFGARSRRRFQVPSNMATRDMDEASMGNAGDVFYKHLTCACFGPALINAHGIVEELNRYDLFCTKKGTGFYING